tara:strand:+ start:439 stop:573 length:135 start_codon:yes stop_codon:yes gene_type:complete
MSSRAIRLIQKLEDSINQKYSYTEDELEDMKEQLRVIREELNGR